MRQEWLLPYENPLAKRFDSAFFRAIPRAPGVYFLRGELDEVLYVGKAKDLRARLRSYRQARPDQVSRKVIRLIRIVRKIEWEECGTEKDALLRENRLLRELKPPFNVVN
jgi:excinuclease UvrABC nuclease subunit